MIEATNISKCFNNHEIFKSLNVNIEENSLTIITGESGKGKTTLLNVLSLIERPDSGTVKVDNIVNPTLRNIVKLRRYTISYLFQNYGLMDDYTVEKNLNTSLVYRKNTRLSISEALTKVGLAGYEKRLVYELSGGEQQRVALARILLKDTKYIFADEPTGNLDRGNRDKIMKLLRSLADEGKGVILATHDLDLLTYADQHIDL